MAGFSAWAQVREAKRNGQMFHAVVHKTGPNSEIGVTMNYWAVGSSPIGTAPVGAVSYVNNTGGVTFPDTGSVHKYLARFDHYDAKGPAYIQILDRLSAFGTIAATGVGAKAAVTAALPRYTDGRGVRAVIETRALTAANTRTLSLTYTNSDGVGGRTSASVVISNPGTGNGVNNRVYYPGLQAGDVGVRSVEALNVDAETGVGTLSVDVVLYYPLIQIVGEPQLTSASAAQSYWLQGRDYLAEISACPRILDGATLSFIAWTGEANGGADASFRGLLEVIYR